MALFGIGGDRCSAPQYLFPTEPLSHENGIAAMRMSRCATAQKNNVHALVQIAIQCVDPIREGQSKIGNVLDSVASRPRHLPEFLGRPGMASQVWDAVIRIGGSIEPYIA